MNFMAIALGAANQIALNLIIEVICATKPAFKFVIVVAAEVVNDHVISRGAWDGNRTRTLKEREILSDSITSAPGILSAWIQLAVAGFP